MASSSFNTPRKYETTTYSNKTIGANNRAWIANVSTVSANRIVTVRANDSRIITSFAYTSDGAIQLYAFNMSNESITCNFTVSYL